MVRGMRVIRLRVEIGDDTGNLDGDGKTDPAVYRPSDQKWYMLMSMDGMAAVRFGEATDVPAPSMFAY